MLPRVLCKLSLGTKGLIAIALTFLKAPEYAINHFQNFYNNVGYPISLARGAYWLGVSYEKLLEKDLENGYTKEFYTKQIKKLYAAVGWDEDNQIYTGKSQPVKWVRIHNLPDFVYFNHAQHVQVGGVDCQTCHGPVDEMEVMYQHSSLTMGWCINCHRETNLKVEDNEYYAKIHEQLSKKYGVEKLTVAQMGGLECGKCHY